MKHGPQFAQLIYTNLVDRTQTRLKFFSCPSKCGYRWYCSSPTLCFGRFGDLVNRSRYPKYGVVNPIFPSPLHHSPTVRTESKGTMRRDMQVITHQSVSVLHPTRHGCSSQGNSLKTPFDLVSKPTTWTLEVILKPACNLGQLEYSSFNSLLSALTFTRDSKNLAPRLCSASSKTTQERASLIQY